jgi:hypothetical protein
MSSLVYVAILPGLVVSDANSSKSLTECTHVIKLRINGILAHFVNEAPFRRVFCRHREPLQGRLENCLWAQTRLRNYQILSAAILRIGDILVARYVNIFTSPPNVLSSILPSAWG